MKLQLFVNQLEHYAWVLQPNIVWKWSFENHLYLNLSCMSAYGVEDKLINQSTK